MNKSDNIHVLTCLPERACLDLHAGLYLPQNALACLCQPGHACLRLHALVCMGHGIVLYIRIHLNSTQASRLQDVVQ